jgi:hypothetical protein
MKSLKQFRVWITDKKELTVLYYADSDLELRSMSLKVYNSLNKKGYRVFDIQVPEQEQLL